MSKGLEALERIESTFVYNKKGKKNVYSIFMGESKAIEEYYKDYDLIKQELGRLEKLEKVIDFLKLNFDISLDSKLRISDGIDCVQAFPIDIDKNVVIYDLVREILGNE